jgi:carboxypeptidase family protein/TonB-dependent receptor-like protein
MRFWRPGMLRGAQREAAVTSNWIRRIGGLAARVAMALCLTNTSAFSQQGAIGTGGVKGFIHDSLGLGLVGVEITLAGSTFRAESDERGEFALARVQPGPLSVRIRRLGFRPDTFDVMVLSGQTIPLDISLNRLALQLAPIVVRGREALTGWRVGFYERKERGAGHFLTRDDIEKRNPAMLTDMFRQLPGVRVEATSSTGFQHVIRFRGNGKACAPLAWLDGSPLSAGEFDLDALSPRSIEAMEIYPGPASVPLQYQSSRSIATACGAIVIWSREGELKPKTRKSAISPATQIAKLVDSKSVFTATQVDIPAHQDSLHLVRPGYPVSLYEAGIGGSVMAEFVVDAGGAVNLDTFSVVFATNPSFTEAVQHALRDAIYVPALRKGYPVMQVVQHEFKFVPDSALARKRNQ